MYVLALALLLAADHQSIIPIFGIAHGRDGTSHFASATVFNPTRRTATIRRTALLSTRCPVPEVWQVPPRATVELGHEFAPDCTDIGAMSVVSDEPVLVTGSITTVFNRFGEFPLSLWDIQPYEAPTTWIEPGMEAVTEARVLEFHRGNLLLVNPNSTTLRVEIAVERPEFSASRTETADVPPLSIRLLPIAELEDPSPSPFPRVVSGRHVLTLRGDGRFQAGASSLDLFGGNVFRKAVPLEP